MPPPPNAPDPNNVPRPDSPCCGGALHAIGEDTSEMLDLVPAQLRVKVIRRPRYGCRACEEAVVQAPAPERPITGGTAPEALLADVVVAQDGDFLPLYRQARSEEHTSEVQLRH